MVELRKRKAPPAAAAPAPKKQAKPPAKAASKPKPKPAETATSTTKAAPVQPTSASLADGKPQPGDTITLSGFGGTVRTNDDAPTTLEDLVAASKAGVVLFTYPKASTPGCTTQACLFRDEYTPLTAKGLAIYGLSLDSPKSNTTFKTKQNLPYPLLCDPYASLIGAIGLKKPGGVKGTVRGVFVVNKEGKVLAAEPGGPAATVDVVKKLIEAM